jgi:hypothetical protein
VNIPGHALAGAALMARAVIYGTDVFCAIVQRPALARVDDRALTSMMGRVHQYGDRRLPAPGVLGIAGAALAPSPPTSRDTRRPRRPRTSR